MLVQGQYASAPGAYSSYTESPSIQIINIQPNETITYPLVLVEGIVQLPVMIPFDPNITHYVEARLDASRTSFWPIARTTKRFKAFFLLNIPGKYQLTINYNGLCHQVVPIEYQPRLQSQFVVRFYYQKCHDATEGFDALPGVDNSDASAIERIRFNALILQTATAELFYHAGFSRLKTFDIEMDTDGLPKVHVLTSTFSNQKARTIHDQELIKLLHQDIVKHGFDTSSTHSFKHAVILGCSKYNRQTQKPEGHTALGGERVGIFGSCGLHTWPRHLGELTACFLDNRRIDTQFFMDDSCYRKSYWANYSTGIGAFLHELGHTFGLGHSKGGIMGRGFDDMNRIFSVYEPLPLTKCTSPAFYVTAGVVVQDGRHLHFNYQALSEVDNTKGAFWHRGSALVLQHCPWISSQSKVPNTLSPSISWARDVSGPVGSGQYDGLQKPFGHPSGQRIAAIWMDVNQYLDDFKTFTYSELEKLSPAQLKSAGTKQWFILSKNEYITQVQVRAMAWIDGLCFITNKRTSQWYGGQGGKMQILNAPFGCCISNFFGTRGDHYIGSLGSRLDVIPSYSAIPSVAINQSYGKSPTAGDGTYDGEQSPFQHGPFQKISGVFIKCDEYVRALRVILGNESIEQLAPNEQLFQLESDEKILSVEIKSGAWIDAIRFHTTIRVSAWYGGSGGYNTDKHSCPEGFKICGFYGTQGKRFIGSVGVLYQQERIDLHDPSLLSSVSAPFADDEFLSLHGTSTAITTSNSSAMGGVLVVLCTEDQSIQRIESFPNHETLKMLLETYRPIQSMVELRCFLLGEGELLLQVDVSINEGNPNPAIQGVCFHTTIRGSAWLGRCQAPFRFLMAPANKMIISIKTSTNLQDLVLQVRPADQIKSSEVMCSTSVSSFAPFVLIDDGTRMDVCIESMNQECPIEHVLLLKKNNGDHLDYFTWSWPSKNISPPRRWFISTEMIQTAINMQSDVRERGQLEDYVIAAIDSVGAYGKASFPSSKN